MAARHACPGGCGVEVPAARLACRSCWFRLPRPLRDGVSAAWGRRAVSPLGHVRAVAAAAQWYRENPLPGGGVG